MSRYRRFLNARQAVAGGSYTTLFSFTTDATGSETLDWSFTNPSIQIRWIINGFTVDSNSISSIGGAYLLDGTDKTVQVQVIGSSITADRFRANFVKGAITISSVTLDGLDLSNSDNLSTYSFTPSASFNHLNLENTGQTYFDTTIYNWDQNNAYLNLSNNRITIQNVAQFLSDIDGDSTSGSTGRQLILNGTNAGIFNGMSYFDSNNDGPALKTSLEGKGWTVSVNEFTAAAAWNFTDSSTMTLSGTDIDGISDQINSYDLTVPSTKSAPQWNSGALYSEFGDGKMMSYETFPSDEAEVSFIAYVDLVSNTAEIFLGYRSSSGDNFSIANSGTSELRNFHNSIPPAYRSFNDVPVAGFNKIATTYNSTSNRIGEKLNAGVYDSDPYTNVQTVTATHISLGGQYLGSSYSTVNNSEFRYQFAMVFTSELTEVEIESMFSYIDNVLVT